jgi:hypothetical protein
VDDRWLPALFPGRCAWKAQRPFGRQVTDQTLHGRDAVVVVDADEFNRLQGARTGELLIDALQASPHRRIEIEPSHSAMPVRPVEL